MKLSSVFALCVVSTALCSATNSSAFIDDPLAGIHALVKRRLPHHANSFNFELAQGTGDSFVVNDSEGGIVVQCTTISACARGLYTCVKVYSNVVLT